MDNQLEARFFIRSDLREDTFIVPLPQTWWSRPYEYAWCAQFVREQEVVLDAACGISHPFKFYLGSRSLSEVHACDWDERIMSRDAIFADAVHDFGEEAAERLLQHSDWSRLHLAHANITSLPYEDNYFDTIFCISVLEHLSDQDQLTALQQFHRVLKPGGRLVLTFDYPMVDLDLLYNYATNAGFVCPASFTGNLPPDALRSEIWGTLYCFRALLQKGS